MNFKKIHKNARDLLQLLHKKYTYNHDILSAKDLEEYHAIEKDLRDILKIAPGDLNEKNYKELEKLDRRAGRFLDRCQGPKNSWQENLEILLVAGVIALALKAYILQPFKIPTASMQPTLYGITTEITPGQKTSFIQSIFDLALFGETHHTLITRQGGPLRNVVEKKSLIPFVSEKTTFLIGDETYTVNAPMEKLLIICREMADQGIPTLRIVRVYDSTGNFRGVQFEPNQQVSAGTEIFNFTKKTGDHVFVNKMAYHFRPPNRSEVFVFTTSGIRELNPPGAPSQYFIKRCVGVPGQTLSIKPPYLLVDGQVPHEREILDRIYSQENGYNGYVLNRNYGKGRLHTPEDAVTIQSQTYWAMGDNSANSHDSRMWGPVPRKNLVGTGFVVYWPFSKRWGLIH